MPTQSDSTGTKKTAKKAKPTQRRPRSTKAEPLDYRGSTLVADTDPSAGPPQQGDDKYLPTAWGNAESLSGPQDLTLPSGQVVLARKPGIQQLMVEGVLHKMDNLTALVDSEHVKKGKNGKPDAINVKALLGDEKALAGILHTVDRVMCSVVIRPHVEMSPNDITRRQSGVIYADTVGIEDKMFLFNWALGGSKDIERFRQESAEVVGSVVLGSSVADPAE